MKYGKAVLLPSETGEIVDESLRDSNIPVTE